MKFNFTLCFIISLVLILSFSYTESKSFKSLKSVNNNEMQNLIESTGDNKAKNDAEHKAEFYTPALNDLMNIVFRKQWKAKENTVVRKLNAVKNGKYKREMNAMEKKLADSQASLLTENTHLGGVRRNNMYTTAKIYHDTAYALSKGIIRKQGNPPGWNDQSYRSGTWNYRHILNIGTRVSYNNGMTAVVPQGYDMFWMRCLSDRWEIFNVRFLDGKRETVGKYACGYRNLIGVAPDGGEGDSMPYNHQWLPIPVGRSGKIIVENSNNTDNWISGVAFGKNLWHHASNPAIAYHWRINGGSYVWWNTHNWYNDNLAMLITSRIFTLIVPITPSHEDKLLYIIEHNNSWLGSMHSYLKVNGHPIERFKTTYDNPFATHYNSKRYSRYLAARVPKNLYSSNAKFITVTLSTQKQNNYIYFREIGTHDIK